jgi:hypothetical protein
LQTVANNAYEFAPRAQEQCAGLVHSHIAVERRCGAECAHRPISPAAMPHNDAQGATKRARIQKVRFHIVVGVAAALANAPAVASDITVVSSCPQKQHIPVEFKVDCSHLEDPAARNLCGRFAQNQACKVFPAYRKITGIDVEQLCPTISYTLYDRDNWPYDVAGGISFRCRINMLAEYALRPNTQSAIGPHEVHEILHQYQMVNKTLDQLTAFHPLFSSSMLEAEREIGESEAYKSGYKRLKQEIQSMQTSLDKGEITTSDMCRIAQAVIEERLYLQNINNFYRFYRTLANSARRNPADEMSAMLNALSGRPVKQFLLAHGCGNF